MLIKAGVDISRLRPAIRKKLTGIAEIVWRVEKQELVITSTYEGTHSAGSLHYGDEAIDIRRGKDGKYVRDEIKRWLGADYDVVLMPTHIHIEYDPK